MLCPTHPPKRLNFEKELLRASFNFLYRHPYPELLLGPSRDWVGQPCAHSQYQISAPTQKIKTKTSYQNTTSSKYPCPHPYSVLNTFTCQSQILAIQGLVISFGRKKQKSILAILLLLPSATFKTQTTASQVLFWFPKWAVQNLPPESKQHIKLTSIPPCIQD